MEKDFYHREEVLISLGMMEHHGKTEKMCIRDSIWSGRTSMDFRTDKLLHGGDYNPEQWLKRPDILAKDIDTPLLSNKFFYLPAQKEAYHRAIYSAFIIICFYFYQS